MKIRTDFVTNSSSSNYITIELKTDVGQWIQMSTEIAADYEGCDNLLCQSKEGILKCFLNMRSMQELFSFLELDETCFDASFDRISFENISFIEVGRMELRWSEFVNPEDEWLMELFKKECGEVLRDEAEFDGIEYDPDNVDWTEEWKIRMDEPWIVGQMELYDLRNRSVETYTTLDWL